MSSFHFEIVAPEKLIFSGSVESVILASSEGEMTVFANHAPLMAMLKPGVITINEEQGAVQKLFVRGGFADIAPGGLTVLAETAIALADLDGKAFDGQLQAAQVDLDGAKTVETKRLASEKLDQLRELKAALAL